MNTSDDVIGPINLGNDAEITVRELAEIVVAITGSESEMVFEALPADDPRQRRPDLKRANELLEWAPATGLTDGLKKTVSYFRDAQLLAGLADDED